MRQSTTPRDLPPSYEEATGQKLEQTGPKRFPAPSWAHIFQLLALFGSALTKGILLCGLFMDNVDTYGLVYRDMQWSWNLAIFPVICNVWQLIYLKMEPILATGSFRRKEILYNKGFIFFVLDIIFLIAYPFCVQQGHFFPEQAQKHTLIAGLTCTYLIAVDCLCLVAFFLVDWNSHDPFKESKKYLLTERFEEAAEENKILSIKESGPFKITIQNVDLEERAISGKFFIERSVEYAVKKKETINFEVNLEPPLLPGQEIRLIPANHSLCGAKNITKYRSFGRERGWKVITSIYFVKVDDEIDYEKTCLVRLVEEYVEVRFGREIGERFNMAYIEERI